MQLQGKQPLFGKLYYDGPSLEKAIGKKKKEEIDTLVHRRIDDAISLLDEKGVDFVISAKEHKILLQLKDKNGNASSRIVPPRSLIKSSKLVLPYPMMKYHIDKLLRDYIYKEAKTSFDGSWRQIFRIIEKGFYLNELTKENAILKSERAKIKKILHTKKETQ